MNCKNNDIIFNKIYDIIDNNNIDLLDKLNTMLSNENIKHYSVDIEKDNVVIIQWLDQKNKDNICAVPLNEQMIEGVKYER